LEQNLRTGTLTSRGQHASTKIKLSNFYLSKTTFSAQTQITGIIGIMDAANFGMKQLKGFTIDNARNLSNFVQVRIFRVTLGRNERIKLKKGPI
jgi:hypothetical protein